MHQIKECTECDFSTFLLLADDVDEWMYCPKCGSLLDRKFDEIGVEDFGIDEPDFDWDNPLDDPLDTDDDFSWNQPLDEDFSWNQHPDGEDYSWNSHQGESSKSD